MPDKPPGSAGVSVKELGAAGGATSFEEDTSHPRFGTARRPAYRRWHVAQGLQSALGALDGRHGRGGSGSQRKTNTGPLGGKVGAWSVYRGPRSVCA